MKILRHLGPRLFISHLAAIATATSTFVITFRLLASEVFGRRLQGADGSGFPGGQPGGPGSPGWGHEVIKTFESSVDIAILISVVVGAVAAAIVAAIVTRLLARPVEDIRATAHSLAAGNYDERVSEPSVAELAELARDVNALASALESTELNRAQLITDVAHELRTPLTTIDGYVEGAADGIFTADEMLLSVSEETRRMRRLVDDLSLLSRAQEGSLDLDRDDTDVTALVEDITDRLRPQFETAGVTLTVTGQTGTASVDTIRLGRVLTNLLGNALGHTAEGDAVTVETSADGSGLLIIVADDGDGIPTDDLPHVFDRFYRGTTTSRSGTGIGLAIARSIVDAHSGTLTAASEGSGKGATFTIHIP
ncbi:MAG: HAMP domain-containing sensor histidine kinase [Actinomycetota bacterium]